jgi:hypothetical protein
MIEIGDRPWKRTWPRAPPERDLIYDRGAY